MLHLIGTNNRPGLLYEWHGKVDQKDLNMHIMGFLPDGVFDIKVSFVPNDQVSFHQIPKLATASVLHGVPAVSAGPASTTPLKQKTANKSTTAQASRKP